MDIGPLLCFFPAGFREARHPFEIANDASGIIKIFTAAGGTFIQAMLVDMSAIIADGIGDIEGKIRAAGYHCGIEHLEILIFGKMLAEVAVVSRPAIEVLRELLATHFEFIKDVFCFVLYEIKIGIIPVTRHEIAIAFIPLGEFDTEIFCRSVAFLTSQCLEFADKVVPRPNGFIKSIICTNIDTLVISCTFCLIPA